MDSEWEWAALVYGSVSHAFRYPGSYSACGRTFYPTPLVQYAPGRRACKLCLRVTGTSTGTGTSDRASDS